MLSKILNNDIFTKLRTEKSIGYVSTVQFTHMNKKLAI